jgi:hypothetical protein
MKKTLKLSLCAAFGLLSAFATASADEWKLTVIPQPHGESHFLYAPAPETVAFYSEGSGVGSLNAGATNIDKPCFKMRDQGHGQITMLYHRE